MTTNFESVKCDLIVIHTNLYAGNFERNMAAFITGKTGDCGVGVSSIQPDFDYSLFENSVIKIPDEHRVLRPVSIYPSPYYHNNGLGFHFRRDDPEGLKKALKAYQDYIHEDSDSHINLQQKTIDDFNENGENGSVYKPAANVGWTMESIQEEIETHQKKKSKINLMTESDVSKYDAYMSVAIPFKKGRITDELISLVKERATLFAKEYENFKNNYRKNILIIEDFEIIK